MKPYLYSLIAAAAFTGLASAQTTAYTTPVGYSSQSLAGPGFNLAGLTLQNSQLAAGKFETITPTAATDNDVTYAPVANRTYVLEITSGALNGAVFEVLASNITGSTINVITVPATNLVTLGLTTSDTYALRLAPTLEEIFTTIPLGQPNGVLESALNATASDIVWLPDGNGGFVKYYLRTGGSPVTSVFRAVATNTASPNIPVVYVDGMIIEKKSGTPATLTVKGDVKVKASTTTLSFGFNSISIVAPVGLNLFNAGLEDDLLAGLNATSADLVWVQNADKSFTKYFRRSGSGAGWRVEGTTTTLTQPQAEAVTLSNSLIIERRDAGTVPLDLNVPSSYSNL
jgi:hypothetical protein